MSKVEIAKHLTLFRALVFADAIVLGYLAIHLAMIWTGVVFDGSWLIGYAGDKQGMVLGGSNRWFMGPSVKQPV